jgi:hypothetical protein
MPLWSEASDAYSQPLTSKEEKIHEEDVCQGYQEDRDKSLFLIIISLDF